MASRLVLMAVTALGAYVLGARAGRVRYEELRHLALGVWNDPATKKTRTKLTKASNREVKQSAAVAARARAKVRRSLR